MIKKSINHAFISRMHQLQIKTEKYYMTHNEDAEIWEGKYAKGSFSTSICPTQQIYINGLSDSEKEELYKNGVMPANEYFNMWVKQ